MPNLEALASVLFHPVTILVSHILTVPNSSNWSTFKTVTNYATALSNPVFVVADSIGRLIEALRLMKRIREQLKSEGIEAESLWGYLLSFFMFCKRKSRHEGIPTWRLGEYEIVEPYPTTPENFHVAHNAALKSFPVRWHFACALNDGSIVCVFLDSKAESRWILDVIDEVARDRLPYSKGSKFTITDICPRSPLEAYNALVLARGDQFLKANKKDGWMGTVSSGVQAVATTLFAFNNGFPKMNDPNLLFAVYAVCSIANTLFQCVWVESIGIEEVFVAVPRCENASSSVKGVICLTKEVSCEMKPFLHIRCGTRVDAKNDWMNIQWRVDYFAVMIPFGIIVAVTVWNAFRSGWTYDVYGKWAFVWLFVGMLPILSYHTTGQMEASGIPRRLRSLMNFGGFVLYGGVILVYPALVLKYFVENSSSQ
ncbi:hypothetical protein HK100_010827 [Physocladia obscura]|uniref:Uncharacterized protein n=1 Tax=Physocladia obscura TaxID=109957 RepID=A0AAD5T3C6_9FUNG|nr:hypothetical protein HK100_010827 [Physocladia obscura]